jgi:septum formation protein
MNTPKAPLLLLASTSSYRRALLERLGVPFEIRPPDVDESSIKSTWKGSPLGLVRHLARAKAESVAERGAVVIGSDQIAVLDGRILGKPGSAAAAVEQLMLLSGRSHDLITAIAIASAGKIEEEVNVTRLTMRPLSAAEIERYVAADMPTDCAGSYKLESRGITLFEAIESDDHTAIVGLPLIALTSILRNLGYRVP